MLDDLHARLARERHDLHTAKEAVAAIRDEPLNALHPTDAMTISELSEALGVTTATLRHWEAEGLVTPDRSDSGNARRYSPAQVRDVRIVHQLRQAGHRIPQLRRLLPNLHLDGDLRAALHAHEGQLHARSRALLKAAATLDRILGDRAGEEALNESSSLVGPGA